MYLMYVDESGDPGPRGSGEFFVLSGLILHESRWAECFALVKQLRVTLYDQFNIRRNYELHGNKNIAGRGALWGRRWPVEDRVRLFRVVLETVAQFPSVRTMSICVQKTDAKFRGQRGRNVHAVGWTFLLQRFHNYIQNARGGQGTDTGIVIHDEGHEVEIRKLMRKLRVFNYVPSRFGNPNRNLPLTTLVEDPISRRSAHAQFIQLVDYIAYSVLRREMPVTKYPRFNTVYEVLQPVVLIEASGDDPMGIVRYPRPGK